MSKSLTATLKIALAQCNFHVGDIPGNTAKIIEAAKKAAETATADDLMADLMDSDDDEGAGEEEAKVETDAANEWQRSGRCSGENVCSSNA